MKREIINHILNRVQCVINQRLFMALYGINIASKNCIGRSKV